MTVTTAMPTSFKSELFSALHDFDNPSGNTFNLVLIKSGEAGTYGAASTNYSNITGNSDEQAASGDYTTGGVALTSVSPTTSGTTAFVDFADLSLTGVTVSVSGCMICNDTNGDRAVYVGSFGSTVAVTAGTLNIVFPTADASNAILRIA